MAGASDLIIKIGALTTDFDTAIDGAFRKIQGFGTAISGAGQALTIGLTAPLAALGITSVSAATDMDSLTRGLNAVTGSSEETQKQLVRLKEVAKLPGLGLREAIEGSINLQAVGISAKESERYLMAFGNALATVGRGKADLDGVIVQLQQMAGKSKVLSEDIKPLIQRVPQIAKIMREEFGTVSTEAIQKMGISSKQFIEVIVSELEKLPRVTTGARTAFENLQDKLFEMRAEIGNGLLPVVERVLDIIDPWIQKVIELAKCFQRLSPDTQTAIIAFGAFAATIGPLLIGIGSLVSAIGTIGHAVTLAAGASGIGALTSAVSAVSAAMATGMVASLTTAQLALYALGAAAGIAAAAFVGWQLGSWAYEQIPGMKALGDSVGDLLLKIPGVETALNKLSGASGAAKTAQDGLEFATSKLEKSLAAKGITVDKTGLTTEQYASQLRAAAKDSGLLSTQEGKAKKSAGDLDSATAKLKGNVDKLASSQSAAETKTKAKRFEDEVLLAKVQLLSAEHQKLVREIAAYELKLESGKQDTIDYAAESQKLTEELAKLGKQAFDVSTIKMPGVIAALGQSETKTGDLNAALQTLGITSSTEYDRVAREAWEAYEVVAGSGLASDWEENTALKKALEAQAEAMKAAGQSIPADMQAMLDDLGKKVGDPEKGISKVSGHFSTFKDSVSTAITNLSQDITDSLFDFSGETSWAKKGMDALTGLGKAVATSFIEPATKAIGEFVSGALADLIGGKGFGGVLDGLKNIGTSMSGIFGGGAASGAASAAGSAAGGAGSIGGGAGSAAGGSAGMGGSLLSGGIAAAGGVAGGLITGFMLTGDLGKIEENTRACKDQLRDGVQPSLNKYLPGMENVSAYLNTILTSHIWRVHDIHTETQNVVSEIKSLATTLKGQTGTQVSFSNCNFGSASPDDIANAIATQLRLQGALA